MEGKENGVTCVLSGDEQELLALWRQLTVPQQEAILEFIKSFTK